MFDFLGKDLPWLHRAGTDTENVLLMCLFATILFVNIV
jgi:hypothetical protein